MRYLRTNTATRITVGPFFDRTDGVTPEVAITVTSEKLTLVVDTSGVPTLVLDVAPTASAGANDMVHITGDDAGFYDLELAAADVNYLGRAMLALTDAAVHVPVFHEFMILPANVYDSMILGSDLLDVSTTQFNGSSVVQSGGRPEVNATHWGGTAVASAVVPSNVIQISGDATAADNLESYTDGTAPIPANTTQWLGTAVATPTVAGVPEVDIVLVDGAATSTALIDEAGVAAAVLDAVAANFNDAGSIGEKINAAGSGASAATIADAVWDEARAGHTTAGTFGQGVASVQGNVTGSVASLTTNNDKTGYALSSAGVQAIWDALTSALTTVGSIGKLLVDNVNAAISSRSSHAAADIWAVATRVLTAGTNIVLAKGTGVTGFNDLSAAQVNTEADTALTDYGALKPTTAGRTLDVAATGEAGLDFDNIKQATGATTLTNITVPTVTTAISLTNAPTAGDLTAAMKASVNAEVDAAILDVGLTLTITGRIDAAISTRLATSGYTVPPTIAAIWEEPIASHTGVSGSMAAALNAAGSSGDPLSTPVPGSYGVTTAGYKIGTFLDAAMSSRLPTANIDLTNGAVTVADASKNGFRLSAAGVDDILDEVVEGAYTLRDLLRGYNSALLGKASGLATTNPKFRDLADSKDRIDATADASGNRSAVILDLAL